jgi:hypothetical protein
MNNCTKSTFWLIFATILLILIFQFDILNYSVNDLNKLFYNKKTNEKKQNIKEIENFRNKLELNNVLDSAKIEAMNDIENFSSVVQSGNSTRNDSSKTIEQLIKQVNNNNGSKGNLSNQFIDNHVVTLIYRQNCPHSQSFIPTWNRLKENLPTSSLVEEIECSVDSGECAKFNIEGVPTIHISSEKYNIETEETVKTNHMVVGNRDYDNIVEELRNNGININDVVIENYENTPINESQYENFVNYISAAQIEASKKETKNRDPDCPEFSFNMPEKDIFCVESIGNQIMIRGCVNGTPGNQAGLTGFDAAYNVFGTILQSLPNPTTSNMNKCIKEHKNTVRQFGLCNNRELAKRANYSNDIKNKKAKPTFLEVDYNQNKKISNALSYACSI